MIKRTVPPEVMEKIKAGTYNVSRDPWVQEQLEKVRNGVVEVEKNIMNVRAETVRRSESVENYRRLIELYRDLKEMVELIVELKKEFRNTLKERGWYK